MKNKKFIAKTIVTNPPPTIKRINNELNKDSTISSLTIFNLF